MLLSDTLTPVGHGQLGKTISPLSLSPSFSSRPLRYAVLGAGFAGLSVTWHLLKVQCSTLLYLSPLVSCCSIFWVKRVCLQVQKSPKEKEMRIDIYDEVGIGGGASGISGGLLHPYSPKGKASLFSFLFYK
jgi:hypothetical protein